MTEAGQAPPYKYADVPSAAKREGENMKAVKGLSKRQMAVIEAFVFVRDG